MPSALCPLLFQRREKSMPTFAYSGRTRGGENVNGERAADNMPTPPSRRFAASRFSSRASRRPRRRRRGRGGRPKKGKLGKKVNPKNLAVFVRQFSVMIDAGLPLVQCLEILGTQEEDKNFAETILADALRRRKRRVARRRDEEAPEGVRSALHQHDCGRRGRRYSRHDSQAARDLHRKSGQAEGPGEVGDDLSRRRHRHRGRRRRRHSVEGHSDLRGAVRRPWRASCRCPRASSSALSDFLVSFMPFIIVGIGAVGYAFKTYYGDRRRAVQDRRHHAEAADARAHDAQDRRGAVLPDAVDAAELGRARFSTVSTSPRARRATRSSRKRFMQTRKSIERGETISAPLKETGVFPPMVTQMIAVGETTGALDTMLVEDRGLLRRRSRHGGRGPVDAARADHDRVPRRRRRRHRHRDVPADLRPDLAAGVRSSRGGARPSSQTLLADRDSRRHQLAAARLGRLRPAHLAGRRFPASRCSSSSASPTR